MSRLASFGLLLATLPVALLLTAAIQKASGWLAGTRLVRRINAAAEARYGQPVTWETYGTPEPRNADDRAQLGGRPVVAPRPTSKVRL